MPPKRASIGRSSSRTRYQRILRSSDTTEDRQARLQASQVQTARARSSETNEQRAERLQADRLRHARICANETLNHRTTRLAAEHERRVQRGVSLSLHHAAFHYDPSINYSYHENVIIARRTGNWRRLNSKGISVGIIGIRGKRTSIYLNLQKYPVMSGYDRPSINLFKLFNDLRIFLPIINQFSVFGASALDRLRFSAPNWPSSGASISCVRRRRCVPLPTSGRRCQIVYARVHYFTQACTSPAGRPASRARIITSPCGRSCLTANYLTSTYNHWPLWAISHTYLGLKKMARMSAWIIHLASALSSEKNSPGRRRVVPKMISDGLASRSKCTNASAPKIEYGTSARTNDQTILRRSPKFRLMSHEPKDGRRSHVVARQNTGDAGAARGYGRRADDPMSMPLTPRGSCRCAGGALEMMITAWQLPMRQWSPGDDDHRVAVADAPVALEMMITAWQLPMRRRVRHTQCNKTRRGSPCDVRPGQINYHKTAVRGRQICLTPVSLRQHTPTQARQATRVLRKRAYEKYSFRSTRVSLARAKRANTRGISRNDKNIQSQLQNTSSDNIFTQHNTENVRFHQRNGKLIVQIQNEVKKGDRRTEVQGPQQQLQQRQLQQQQQQQPQQSQQSQHEPKLSDEPIYHINTKNPSPTIVIAAKELNNPIELMLDTGAAVSVIKNSKISREAIVNFNKTILLRGITNKTIRSIGETVIRLNNEIPMTFQVVDGDFPIKQGGILGTKFFANIKGIISYETNTLRFGDYSIPFHMQYLAEDNKINTFETLEQIEKQKASDEHIDQVTTRNQDKVRREGAYNDEQFCTPDNVHRETTYNDRRFCTPDNVHRETTYNDKRFCTPDNVHRKTTYNEERFCTLDNVYRGTKNYDERFCTPGNVHRETTYKPSKRIATCEEHTLTKDEEYCVSSELNYGQAKPLPQDDEREENSCPTTEASRRSIELLCEQIKECNAYFRANREVHHDKTRSDNGSMPAGTEKIIRSGNSRFAVTENEATAKDEKPSTTKTECIEGSKCHNEERIREDNSSQTDAAIHCIEGNILDSGVRCDATSRTEKDATYEHNHDRPRLPSDGEWDKYYEIFGQSLNSYEADYDDVHDVCEYTDNYEEIKTGQNECEFIGHLDEYGDEHLEDFHGEESNIVYDNERLDQLFEILKQPKQASKE
ncbi:unnamed protein product [Trichogramma brassicae]|uniref:Peptidase A2 domain-containing protein n=1 Tax=Trichogramma brassicae TaxID=86971 RepID=A0A6H5IZV4_9HYME|nr:unnamed protein product [Trichogramma brassicae]